jgi:hypothetical protein
VVVTAITVASLPALIIGGLVAGAGAGVTFKFSVGSVMRMAPEGARGESLANLFVSGYVGMSVPVMLLGLMLQAIPLVPSAVLFGAGLILVLAPALILSHRTRLSAAGRPLP